MRASILLSILGILLSGCSHSSVGPGTNIEENTARYKLSDVNALAESYGRGLELISVLSTNVSTDGTSGEWSYQYSDTSVPPTAYAFHCKNGAVGFDSAYTTDVGEGFINRGWFNSDSALSIAEQNGGSEFRAQNPHNTILASLRDLTGPDPTTMWEIAYQSNDSYLSLLVIRIDAISGAIIAKYE